MFGIFTWIPLGIALASILSLYQKYPEPEFRRDFSIVLILFLVSFVLYVAQFDYKRRLLLKTWLSEKSLFFARQTVVANSEGVSIESALGKSNYKWPIVINAAEDDFNLYLFLDNSQAIIIPKSAMTLPDDLRSLKSRLPPTDKS